MITTNMTKGDEAEFNGVVCVYGKIMTLGNLINRESFGRNFAYENKSIQF